MVGGRKGGGIVLGRGILREISDVEREDKLLSANLLKAGEEAISDA